MFTDIIVMNSLRQKKLYARINKLVKFYFSRNECELEKNIDNLSFAFIVTTYLEMLVKMHYRF